MRGRHCLVGAGALLFCGVLGVLAFDRCRSASPDARLERGLAAARAGDYDRADRLADLLDEANETDRYHLLRGETAFLRTDFERALNHLGQVRAPRLRLRAADLSGRCL